MRTKPLAELRAFLLVTAVVLLTSRVMLLVHEFGGHGAPATLLGGRITGWYLFLFAGGRVSYEIGDVGVAGGLLISLGGIALELVFGAIALVAARKLSARPIVAFCLLCTGTAVVGHAAVYLARGVHYGFGDGALLARVLGGARWVVVFAASAGVIALGVFAGRRLVAQPAAWFGGSPWRVASTSLAVFLCAGIVHGALAWVEVTQFGDPAWAAVMEDAAVVAARAELRRQAAEAAERGEPPASSAEQQREMEALERARRPWPLDPVLLTALVAALAVGVARGARDAVVPCRLPRWGAIGCIAVALGMAILVTLILRLVGAPAR